jgi:hypothetical protein
MPICKVTMFFELQTQHTDKAIAGRVGGWTESWYYPGDVSQAIQETNAAKGLSSLRAAMLPRTGAVVAQRFQIVDTVPKGSSTMRFKNFPGGGFETDQPQVAILVNVPTTQGKNVKKLILRGIPDQFIIDGEFTPDPIFTAALIKFQNEIGLYRFRGQDFTRPLVPIVSITSVGQVTMVGGVPFANGDKVQIIGPKLITTGRTVPTKTYTVLNPAGNTFTAANWSQPALAEFGNARIVAPAFYTPDTDNIEVERSIVRKVGRPFDLYRGRRRAG